jgi:benzil reductase ((S)-benzoin forming)
MNCYIVTGASRGLGLGIARAVVKQGGQLIALARSESAELAELGRQSPGYRFVPMDLVDPHHVSQVAEELCGSVAAMAWKGVYLINNAGVVEPVGLAGTYDDAALVASIQINLSSALVLCNAFIRHFQAHGSDRRILNISSGAGRGPYPSWSAYCTGKAGLEMYSRCVGQEQQAYTNGIRITAMAPGIIDTGMQAAIRSHSTDEFSMVEQFRAYKANGDLSDPNSTGAEILQALHSDRLVFGEPLHIKDFR